MTRIARTFLVCALLVLGAIFAVEKIKDKYLPPEAPSSFAVSSEQDETNPNKEFIHISIATTGPTTTLGHTLRITDGVKEVMLGKAVEIFRLGTIQATSSIFAPPGSKLVYVSGESPVGTSFRTNICTGFLEQFQDFYPPLEQNCPAARTIIARLGISLEESCLPFLDRIPTCSFQYEGFSSDTPASCAALIRDHVNYTGCVRAFEPDAEFLRNEWRLFGNFPTELWGATTSLQILEFDDSVVWP